MLAFIPGNLFEIVQPVRATILLSGDPGSFSVDSLRLLLIAYLAL